MGKKAEKRKEMQGKHLKFLAAEKQRGLQAQAKSKQVQKGRGRR